MRRHHLGRQLWGLRIQSSNKGGEISLTPWRLRQVQGAIEQLEKERLAEGELKIYKGLTPDWTLAYENKQVFAMQDPAIQEHYISALRAAGAL